jgi:hypothetical protein
VVVVERRAGVVGLTVGAIAVLVDTLVAPIIAIVETAFAPVCFAALHKIVELA